MRSNRLNENEHLRLQTASSRQVDALFSTLAMELMHLRLPGTSWRQKIQTRTPPKAVRFHVKWWQRAAPAFTSSARASLATFWRPPPMDPEAGSSGATSGASGDPAASSSEPPVICKPNSTRHGRANDAQNSQQMMGEIVARSGNAPFGAQSPCFSNVHGMVTMIASMMTTRQLKAHAWFLQSDKAYHFFSFNII